ncbi:uncharacterized protein LOC128932491 isoform X3 [Callithrix jacchus]
MCTEALTLVPWSPALSCVSSSNQAGPLVFTGIDGQPGGRLVLGLQAPGQYLSASSSAPRVLKLRPFLMPWSPALSCVRFSTQVGPLALISIDGETRRRIASHLLFLGQWPAAGCPAPGALKLRPFLLPWSPALILGAASWDQAKERAPCGSRLAVWPALCLGASARQPGPIPWCVEAQALPGTLVSCTELCQLFCPGGPFGIDLHRWEDPAGVMGHEHGRVGSLSIS